VVDDRDSWSKTTAQPRELATQEESPNGRAERRLAGSEGAAAAYLGTGKSYKKERKLGPAGHFYTQEERERGVWSCTSAIGRRHRVRPMEPSACRVSPARSR
jgi:hypothetical protein